MIIIFYDIGNITIPPPKNLKNGDFANFLTWSNFKAIKSSEYVFRVNLALLDILKVKNNPLKMFKSEKWAHITENQAKNSFRASF